MTNQSLSDLWRENRSKDPGTDLASILDGARIIAQSLNPGTEVTFAGVKVASTDRKQICLSPKDLGSEYPISGDKVDILLGLTVHEVGHTLFSEDKGQYTDKLMNKAGYIPSNEYKNFRDLVNVFEDIYVDHLMTAYPGYRDYLTRERAWALGGFNPDSITKPLEAKCTRQDMLNAMIYLTLAGGKVPKNIADANFESLGKIATYAKKMCTKKVSKQSAILGAWKTLKGLPLTLSDEDRGLGVPTPSPKSDMSQPVPDQAQEDVKSEQEEQEKLETQEDLDEETKGNKSQGEAEAGEQEEDKEDGEQGASNTKPEVGEDEEEEEGKTPEMGATEGAGDDTGEEDEDTKPEIEPDPNLDLSSKIDNLVNDNTTLPQDLAQEVSDAIVEKKADLTQLLSHIAKDSNMTIIAYTPPEDAEASANARAKTSTAEEKLRRILQDYRLKRTKDYRGLMSGRISGRRLHRVAYGDQRVFQRRERPDEIDMAVCLLMDLSGSVHRFQSLIEQITCAICDAFQKEKLEFIALGYSNNRSSSQVASIPRLYDRETGKVSLGLHREWASTPSYEGLAAGIAQLLRLGGKKQKILFHFTDGEPNTGQSNKIPELLKDAKTKGITDIHVCLTSDGTLKTRFGELYGKDTMIINDINELPDIIDKELRRRLQI